MSDSCALALSMDTKLFAARDHCKAILRLVVWYTSNYIWYSKQRQAYSCHFMQSPLRYTLCYSLYPPIIIYHHQDSVTAELVCNRRHITHARLPRVDRHVAYRNNDIGRGRRQCPAVSINFMSYARYMTVTTAPKMNISNGIYQSHPSQSANRARQLYKNISMLFLFPVTSDLLFTNI